MTARDITHAINDTPGEMVELYVVRPRLTELKKLGFIETCGRALDPVTGIKVSVWKLRT